MGAAILRLMPDLFMGWFAIAFSKEVLPGSKKLGFLANEAYSLSRNERGELSFSHQHKPLMEQNGVIFVWHHPDGHAPLWTIPCLDETGWTPFLHHQLMVQTHPQEVYENSIDLTHFSMVHGFKNLSVIQAPFYSNHNMSVKYQILRSEWGLFRRKKVAANFEVLLHGIGCAHTHINVAAYDMRVRMFALTTPTLAGIVEIRLAVALLNHWRKAKQLFIPMIHRRIHNNIVHDFCQDIRIWENKCYRKDPLLVKGDDHILSFRRWCEQFYETEKSIPSLI